VYLDEQEPVDGWNPKQPYGVPHLGGFFAELYFDEEKRWVLAIRGTDDGPDLIDDLSLFRGNMPPQMAQAYAALRRARSRAGEKGTLCLTGHSLGGALAAMLAVDSGLHAVTFDAPGAARSYGAAYANIPFIGTMLSVAAPAAAFTARILNIRASGDIVSIGTGPRFGRVESIEVDGCAPYFSQPFGDQRPPHPRAVHDYGRPSLESQAWNAFSSVASYPLCQHKMALMAQELKRHPEYNQDLGW
jgi:hypothetical protein